MHRRVAMQPLGHHTHPDKREVAWPDHKAATPATPSPNILLAGKCGHAKLPNLSGGPEEVSAQDSPSAPAQDGKTKKKPGKSKPF